MTVAAVVVRWRGGDEVARCLRSIVDRGAPHVTRLVLVDSGSGDGGAEVLARSHPQVELLALPENRSFAWAANRGAELCDQPYLLLINPDAELLPGSLDPLLEFADQHPRSAGAVPLLIGPDRRPQHRWQLRRLPNPMRLAAGLPGAPESRKAPTADRPFPVEQPAAAAWLVRGAVWRALGGFDPGYAPAWWEDVDFCARLRQELRSETDWPDSGFWVVPESRMLHIGGSSVGHLSDAEFLIAFFGNLERYARRHHAESMSWVGAGLRLSLLVRAAISPRRRHAYLDALSSLPRGALGS